MKYFLHPILLITALTIIKSSQVKSQNINISGPSGSELFGESVTVLTNGNYVISDPYYNEGIIGTVNGDNSLIGGFDEDRVGIDGITALSNGNYVVRSSYWRNDVFSIVGAVTWGDGGTGTSGVISRSNSLVGSTANDKIGVGGITILSNGNYVVKFYLPAAIHFQLT